MGHKVYLPADTTKHLRPAGLGSSYADTARKCMTWETERPTTPDKIKPYRQSTVHEPGVILRHYGAARDPVDFEATNGVKSSGQADLKACLKAYPESDIMRWKLERSEDVYASAQREPLGRGWVRGHKLPPGMGDSVAFGMRTDRDKDPTSTSLARGCIAPVNKDYEDSDEPGTMAHALYTKSHGSYAPGEQRKREYDWANTQADPATFRFGAVDRTDVDNGVGKALNPLLDTDLVKPPQIVERGLEEHRLVSGDVLGKSRILGSGDRGLPADFVYGKASLVKGIREDGVEKLLGGYYAPAEQQPDADLGRSLRTGYRNVAPADGRAFGIPSVRTDLPLPAHTSVANTLNFGNEPDAGSLLSPCATADRGVNEKHYLTKLSKGDIKQLLVEASIVMADDMFDACFQASVQADGGADTTSLQTFMDCRHYVLHRQAGL